MPPPLCPSGPGHAAPPVCGSYPRISLLTTLSFLSTSHISYHTHHLQPPTHHLQCTHKTHTCTEVHLTPKQIAGFSPIFVSFIAALQRLQRTVAFLPDLFLFLQGCLSPKPQPFSCALSPSSSSPLASRPSCCRCTFMQGRQRPCLWSQLSPVHLDRSETPLSFCPVLSGAAVCLAVVSSGPWTLCSLSALPVPLWEPSTPAKPVTSPPLSLACPFLPLHICSQWWPSLGCCSPSRHLPPAPDRKSVV